MRKIEDKVFNYINDRLKNHGAAQEAIRRKDARSLFIYACEVCVGIKEQGGNNSGPLVESMQRTVNQKNNKEAWCMCFIQTMIAFVERMLGVESDIYESEHCQTVWNKTDPRLRVKRMPAPGAIAIWAHYEKVKSKLVKTSNGHTGMVVEANPMLTIFESVEGNTEGGFNPSGTVIRDGGGVYWNRRSLKARSGSTMQIIGFLRPFDTQIRSAS